MLLIGNSLFRGGGGGGGELRDPLARHVKEQTDQVLESFRIWNPQNLIANFNQTIQTIHFVSISREHIHSTLQYTHK